MTYELKIVAWRGHLNGALLFTDRECLGGAAQPLILKSDADARIAELQEKVVYLTDYMQGADARIAALEERIKLMQSAYTTVCASVWPTITTTPAAASA